MWPFLWLKIEIKQINFYSPKMMISGGIEGN